MWQERVLLPGGHGRVNKPALSMAVSYLEGGGPAEGYKREQGKGNPWFKPL